MTRTALISTMLDRHLVLKVMGHGGPPELPILDEVFAPTLLLI